MGFRYRFCKQRNGGFYFFACRRSPQAEANRPHSDLGWDFHRFQNRR